MSDPAGIEVGTPGYYWDPATLNDQDWTRIVRRFGWTGQWASTLGPQPGLLGCLVPWNIAQRFGYDVFGEMADGQRGVMQHCAEFGCDRIGPLNSHDENLF